MANEKVEYVFSIEDTDGSSTNVVMTANFDATPDLAAIQAAATSLAADIDAVIDGRIYATAFRMALTTAPALLAKVVPANIEVQVGATMSFKNDNFRRASWFIPTLKKTLLPNGILNTAHADVGELISTMLDIGAQGWQIVDQNLIGLTGLTEVRGKETTRKLKV